MATRGSIPKVMEIAGIDMLPPEAGVPLIRRELTAGRRRGEIVIGQRLGVLLKEWDETGGLEISAEKPQGPMLGKIASAGLFQPLKVETTLDPKVQPFLYDHRIDGTPVLPGVMGLEAFAEAALSLLPGWHVEAIEKVHFLAPFKFYRNEARTVTVEAVIHPQGEAVVAECRLVGHRTLPSQTEPQVTTHFTGQVRLVPQQTRAELPVLGEPEGNVIQAAEIYHLYFHGPAYQVIERAWWDGKRMVGLLSKNLPDNHHPSELPLTMAPRLIELCFQTAGVWEMGIEGRMGLPQHIDRIVSFVSDPAQAEGPLYAVVTPHEGGFDAEVVDTEGKCYVQFRGYRTVTIPNAVDAEGVQTLRAAMLLHPVAA
jgi:hypothetical protein